jgi:hypothetical protein
LAFSGDDWRMKHHQRSVGLVGQSYDSVSPRLSLEDHDYVRYVQSNVFVFTFLQDLYVKLRNQFCKFIPMLYFLICILIFVIVNCYVNILLCFAPYQLPHNGAKY